MQNICWCVVKCPGLKKKKKKTISPIDFYINNVIFKKQSSYMNFNIFM